MNFLRFGYIYNKTNTMNISELKKECGVYIIKNTINDYVYIGSSNNVYRRVICHKHLLGKNKHYNTHLQNFVNKYGLNVLNIEVLTYCTVNEQFIMEENYFKEYPNKFNVLSVAHNVPLGLIGNKKISVVKLIEYNKNRPYMGLEFYHNQTNTFKPGQKFDNDFLIKMRIGKILKNNNFNSLDEAIEFKRNIFELKAQGYTETQVGDIVGKNQSTINRILSEKIWREIEI
jgi:group I intron endonuclease